MEVTHAEHFLHMIQQNVEAGLQMTMHVQLAGIRTAAQGSCFHSLKTLPFRGCAIAGGAADTWRLQRELLEHKLGCTTTGSCILAIYLKKMAADSPRRWWHAAAS